VSTSAVERLQRILELEERQGYRNRAVIRGFQEMAPRWADQARGEGVDPRLITRAEAEMMAYAERDQAARIDAVASLRRALAGDEGVLSEPVATAPAVSPPVVPPAAQSDQPDKPAVATQEVRQQAQQPAQQPAQRQEQRKEQQARPPKQQPSKGGQQRGSGPGPAAGDDRAPGDSGSLGSTWVFDYEDADAPAQATATPAPTLGKRSGVTSTRRPEELDAPVKILHGVGDAVSEILGRLGVSTPRDLIWHLPSRYEDYSQQRRIAELTVGEQVTVIANLWEVQERKIGPNRVMIQATFSDGTGTIQATFWSKWVLPQLKPHVGGQLRLSGKVGSFRGYRTLDNPAFEELDQESVSTGRVAPIYPATEGITQKKLRQLTHQVLEDFSHLIEDPLAAELLAEQGLLDVQSALWQIHFPDTLAAAAEARQRFAFEELFYVQLGVLQRRAELKQSTALALPSDETLLEQFMQGLPFPLTGAQQRVLAEVALDLASTVPMTRLVQGDVGSGKTAVAAGAMWIAAANGAQSAMLAPTQILAEQHHRGISRLLEGLTRGDGSPLQVALLTGRVTGGAREQILAGLADGSIDIVVGTTALIQEGVEFANLALAVVDEQHRFGVEQRGALRSRSAQQPHLLAMSATPIPRSLALTVFGDLDLSILNEMPPGRLPVKTVIFRPFERERVYDFLRREAGEGRQAFIVYPLVEESEALDAGAATEAAERLQREVFPELRVALLHGQMKGAEKDAIMTAFAQGEHDILVATTVIEVGIDVPNASVIIIEDAERFGLAQLHQLRGRVGRGGLKSFCVLVTRAEGDAAEDRLRVLERTNDGFVLAEEDLRRRGPGEFLGTRQTGLPELLVAQFSDLETVEKARAAAVALFSVDPMLTAHPAILQRVRTFWRGEGDLS
jgi:ATP-dependent DNA helicase RecG